MPEYINLHTHPGQPRETVQFWRSIFPRGRVPVRPGGPIFRTVGAPPDARRARVYLVDLDALHPQTFDRLIRALAARWGCHPGQIAADWSAQMGSEQMGSEQMGRVPDPEHFDLSRIELPILACPCTDPEAIRRG